MRQQPHLERVKTLPPRAVKSHLRKTPVRPDLSIEQILKWADHYFKQHGNWPRVKSGYIPQTIDDTWQRIDAGLRVGTRSLPRNGNNSLARLLTEKRGARNPSRPPEVTVSQIRSWCRAHHKRTGQWPTSVSGKVFNAPGENWNALDVSLRNGARGLEPGSSLARLLAQHCGVPNRAVHPRLSISQILAWCDAYRRRTGRWPSNSSGQVDDGSRESWQGIDGALRDGVRGLPGGSSLAQLLAQKRGKRTRGVNTPSFTEKQILAWCDTYRERTGEWPKKNSGAIPGVRHEQWSYVDAALRAGTRGLPGGSSLAQLLARKRAVRNLTNLPPLSHSQILAWADAHRAKSGRWPNVNSGLIAGTIDDTWSRMDNSLREGNRGLPRNSGMTLARLLERERGVRNSEYPPKLSSKQIIRWARAHQRRSGKWPTANSGAITESPEDTWLAIDMALRKGRRGLKKGGSLHRFLCDLDLGQ